MRRYPLGKDTSRQGRDKQIDDFSLEQAGSFYRRVTDPTAKSILDFLIDHPDERLDSAAIVEQLGLARHRDVAESTYLMGQIGSELGLQRPWTEAQVGYLMPAGHAAILREAREQMSGAPTH